MHLVTQPRILCTLYLERRHGSEWHERYKSVIAGDHTAAFLHLVVEHFTKHAVVMLREHARGMVNTILHLTKRGRDTEANTGIYQCLRER